MDVKRTTLRDNTLQKNLMAETRIPMEETEKVNKLDTAKPNNNTVDETNIIRRGGEEIEQSEEGKADTNTKKSDLDKELEEEKAEKDTLESDMDERLEDKKTDRNKAEGQKEEVIDREETVLTTKSEEQRSKMIEAEPKTATIIKEKPSIFSRKKSIKEDIYKTTAQKVKEGLSTREKEPPRT